MGSQFDNIMRDADNDVRAGFGEPCTLTRGAASVEFTGILDLTARTETVGSADVPTEGTQPRLDVDVAALGDLGRPQHGDHVTARGVTYEVVTVEPGSSGCVVCWLLEVVP